MKRTYPFLKLAIILLFVLNIFLLIVIKKDRAEYQNLSQSYKINYDSLKQFKNFNNIWLLNFSLMCEFQSDRIDSNIVLFDENDNKITLKQLGVKKPKFIFKYSALNCNSCVDEQITLLKRASKKIGSENILIITDYNTPRELSQFVRLNQIDFRILNLRNIKLTTIDNNLPYYFIIDESYSLKQLFIPIKGNVLLTQQYLDKISEKYFHWNLN